MKVQPLFSLFLSSSLPQLLLLKVMALQPRKEACGVIRSVLRFSSFKKREQFKSSTTSGGRILERFAVETKRTRNQRRMHLELRILAECLWFCCVALRLPFSWPFLSFVGIQRKMRRLIDNRCVQRWQKS